MKRVVLAAALALLTAGPAAASFPPDPGEPCEGTVDVACRGARCAEEELDCGMKPPCVVWTYAAGCLTN